MTFIRATAIGALLFCSAGPVAAQAVKLEFHDGTVNLTTQNASMRAILNEWARLGGTQVVNADRLGGAPLTLELTNISETQALDIILRGSAGYIAGLRPGPAATGTRSALDRIMVVPTAGTAAVVASRPVTAGPALVTPPPQAFVQMNPDDNPVSDVPPNDDIANRAGRAGVPINIQRSPQIPPQPFQTFPLPQDDNGPQQPANTPAPTNPFGIQTGSSRPGTISPVPAQPTQRPPQRDPEP